MNERHVSPAAFSARDTAQLEGAPRAVAVPPQPQAARSPGWTGGRITVVVIGVLLALVALGLLGTAGTALWADLTQREDGYVTSGEHDFSTAGSALSTKPTHLGSAGVEWLYSPNLLGKIRVRVTPLSTSSPLFVGIARSSDVDRYLAGVNHTVVSDFFDDNVRTVSGGPARSSPASQHFWAASSTGPGERTLTWKAHSGSWTVVVMRADGRPRLDVRTDLGARMPAVIWIAIGLLAAGAVFLTGGVLLIVGQIRGVRAGRASEGAQGQPPTVSVAGRRSAARREDS